MIPQPRIILRQYNEIQHHPDVDSTMPATTPANHNAAPQRLQQHHNVVDNIMMIHKPRTITRDS